MKDVSHHRTVGQPGGPKEPKDRASSFQMFWTRLAALMRAWRARDEDEARDQLRRLAEEALILSQSKTLWPNRPVSSHRDDS